MVLLTHPFKVLETYPVQTLATQMTTNADYLTCALTFLVFSSLGRAETRYTSSVNVIERDTAATMHLPLLHQRCFQKFATFSLRRATGAESWKKAQETVLTLSMSSFSFDVTTPITLHTFEIDVFVSWNSWFAEVEVVYFRNTRPSIITTFYQNQWFWVIKLLNRF